MYWHMSRVAEVTAGGNQQQKRQRPVKKRIVGLEMRPLSSQQIKYPDGPRASPQRNSMLVSQQAGECREILL